MTDPEVTFNPPLWMQRRSVLNRILQDLCVKQVVDLGCGEGAILDILVHNDTMEHLIGLDIDLKALEIAVHQTKPAFYDLDQLRPNPMRVEICHGDLSIPFEQALQGRDCIVSMEVIEHLHEPVLQKFQEHVFGLYKPKYVVVSTPNAEFNVYFDSSKFYHGKFRHDDHKFEWTRKEFENWAHSMCNLYGYNVEFTGVGFKKDDPLNAGPCTQIAIFKTKDEDWACGNAGFISEMKLKEMDVDGGLAVKGVNVYPHLQDESVLSDTDIVNSVIHYLKTELSNCHKYGSMQTENHDDDSDTEQSAERSRTRKRILTISKELDALWDVFSIKQKCKTRHSLKNALLNGCNPVLKIDRTSKMLNDGLFFVKSGRVWSTFLDKEQLDELQERMTVTYDDACTFLFSN